MYFLNDILANKSSIRTNNYYNLKIVISVTSILLLPSKYDIKVTVASLGTKFIGASNTTSVCDPTLYLKGIPNFSWILAKKKYINIALPKFTCFLNYIHESQVKSFAPKFPGSLSLKCAIPSVLCKPVVASCQGNTY